MFESQLFLLFILQQQQQLFAVKRADWMTDSCSLSLFLSVGFAVEVAVVIKGEMCLCFSWPFSGYFCCCWSGHQSMCFGLSPFWCPFCSGCFPFFAPDPFTPILVLLIPAVRVSYTSGAPKNYSAFFGITLFSFLGLNVIWLSSISLACILATVFTF